MTVKEFYARLIINAVIMLIGVFIVAGGTPGGTIIILAGTIGVIWTAISAKRQIAKMDAAVAEKRARQSSSS